MSAINVARACRSQCVPLIGSGKRSSEGDRNKVARIATPQRLRRESAEQGSERSGCGGIMSIVRLTFGVDKLGRSR